MKRIKKIVTAVIATVMIIMPILSISVFALDEDLLRLDVDSDGYVTAADARYILRVAARLETVEIDETALYLMDANDDGKITAADSRLTLYCSSMLRTIDDSAPVRKGLDYDRSESVTNIVVNFNWNLDIITLTLSGVNMEGTQAVNLFIEYDDEILEFDSSAKKKDVTGIFCCDKIEDGLIGVGFACVDQCPSDSDLFYINFKVLTDETSEIQINIATWIGCDAPDDITVSVAACTHLEYELRNAVEATDHDNGYTGDKYCCNCGKLLEKGQNIPFLGLSEGNFKYRYDESVGGAVITGFSANANVSKYVVPSTLGGYEVVGVAKGAFMDNEISEVAFPNTIRFIEYPAFGYYSYTGELIVFDSFVLYGCDSSAVNEYAEEYGIMFVEDCFGAESGYVIKPGTDVRCYENGVYIMLNHANLVEYLKKDYIGNEKADVINPYGFELSEYHSVYTGCRVNIEDCGYNFFVAVIGDADGNGKISAADARIVLRASAGLEHLSDAYFVAADVDRSDFITASDARWILRKSAGLEY